MKHGFVKAAAASPEIRVADVAFNTESIINTINEAGGQDIKLLVLPELCLTGSTCGHLFHQRTLLDAALSALVDIVRASAGTDMLVFVGMPLAVGGHIYSVAAAVHDGMLRGFVPRAAVSGTVFSALGDKALEVNVPGLYSVCLSTDILFDMVAVPGMSVGVVLGEDAALPFSPAVRHCAAGATVIAELKSAPMSVFSAKREFTRLETDTLRCSAAAVSAAPGTGESTTDKSYSGLCCIAEDGVILASDESGVSMAISEIDTEYLVNMRRKRHTFDNVGEPHAIMRWGDTNAEETVLTRRYSRTPFLPDEGLDDFCERALRIQVAGVTQRMRYTGYYKPVIGVSGGVDSTLVMLACARALRELGLPKENLIAVTMPCFGTTDRTKNNAITIAEELGATLRVIPIGDSVREHFKAIDHDFENRNVVFENAQARERTMCLMDIANEVGGLDIGTKDLSEQADGWCTFNGDQISNYDINAGLTKTMVKAVVRHVAAGLDNERLKAALLDIDSTPVTPELLPPSRNGELIQKSEESVGPYILQDFFLYHMIMHSGSPEKVLRLAEYAFGDEYDRDTLIKWLKSYCRRFFSQQFKRSCSADGPDAVGFTLSPRDGHKMPSDAENTLWLNAAEKL